MGFVNIAYAAEEGLSIHLSPDAVTTVFGVPITNTMLTVWLTMAILAAGAIFLKGRLSLIPGKFQSLVEMLVVTVFDYMSDVLESRSLARRFFPLVMTIFIFILLMNWVGLLPGVDSVGIHKQVESHGEVVSKMIPFFHPPATDLNITIAFALVAFVSIELAGVTMLGFFKYSRKFLNLSMFRSFTRDNIIGFFLGIIELISELARLISFSFRLFGNIFAGKTLLMVVMFLATPYLLPVPLIAYEFFVGFIQAFIFAILTLFFIKLAIEEPH